MGLCADLDAYVMRTMFIGMHLMLTTKAITCI